MLVRPRELWLMDMRLTRSRVEPDGVGPGSGEGHTGGGGGGALDERTGGEAEHVDDS